MFDAEYLTMRSQQELRAAMRSSDLRVRQAHLELADGYASKLREARRERGVAFILAKENAA